MNYSQKTTNQLWKSLSIHFNTIANINKKIAILIKQYMIYISPDNENKEESKLIFII
jgi:hypothetical protein